MHYDGFAKYWLPVYIYAALIYIFSSMSKPIPVEIPIPSFDKFVHVVEYGLLALLTARALKSSPKNFSIITVNVFSMLATTLYGASDEFHQRFVPGRISSGWDVLADFVGAVVGVLVYSRYLKKNKKNLLNA